MNLESVEELSCAMVEKKTKFEFVCKFAHFCLFLLQTEAADT